ncbi:putative transport protein [Roseimicrobium gellanilyticum]|uniref:Putative transport protein n=1 Tax=Roseimicrobium gellanilyticum TaxID=748857 RepID=A0A366H7L4_9BACT|nr:putative transporter [Roseimicrobium gellanilyticum]RBP38046.1 putative transport protein [Roseimicrobium gellanilyticum]
MRWLTELHQTQPIAHAIGVLAFVCVLGMALGSVKFRGIKLGTAGVLFAGILVGHLGEDADHHTLAFVKEFGLVLFVFTIGLQLGPGFFAALRQQGVKLNLLAAAVVFFGAVGAALAGWIGGFQPEAVLGIFSGASTNTPSLGASTQTISTLPGITEDRLALPALAYAVSYPTAIVAIIGTLLLLKQVFRIDPMREAKEYADKQRSQVLPLERRTFVVTNPNLEGVLLKDLPGKNEANVTISRVKHGMDTSPATDTTVLHRDDVLLAVGPRGGLDTMEKVIGQRTDMDLMLEESAVTFRRVVVTEPGVLGKTVGEMDLDDRFHVAVTRVTRADIEMSAVLGLRLQFGDQLQLVGRSEDLDKAASAVGNSLKELNETHFIPFFIGIALGIVLGTMPIAFPGLPHPIRLGLAGGPLIVALILARVGHIGRQVWHMPINTNLAFREFGIALFFAAVGLSAGAKFFETVFSATGIQWLVAGACVTIIPLALVAAFARVILKMNFMELSGLVAGSMTDPPALAFASNIAGSDAPTVAYATVFPLTTLLRILAAQILAITLCS